MSRTIEPVTSVDEVIGNILRFDAEVASDPRLQDRLSRVHAWYAHRVGDGHWALAPSKFVGYRENTAAQYLRTSKDEANGGETERAINRLGFRVVELDTRLGRELETALTDYLERWSKRPRKGFRIATLETINEATAGTSTTAAALVDRISVDPRVAGGRPCIKGTRVRVSDIVEMMAFGADRAEILADYPYLVAEDISAALAYAARATSHRVVRAA